MKYEHAIGKIQTWKDDEEVAAHLDAASADGWELVASVYIPRDDHEAPWYRFFFRRPVDSGGEGNG